jgi:hypothetical protein
MPVIVSVSVPRTVAMMVPAAAAALVAHMPMQGPRTPLIREQVIDERVHRSEAGEHVRHMGEVLATID